MADKPRYDLADLLRLMQRLRDPEHGCPWDLAQDFKSIVPSTLEECYELADAIEREDFVHVADELGDVLFQVIFYAQLGQEQGLFDFAAVTDGLVRKLIRRHPHVFANGELEGVVRQSVSRDDVKQSWEAIKASERRQRQLAGVLDDVPVALPALPRAQKIQKRAASIGFDWADANAVFDKLEEELAELREAVASGDREHQDEELGDLLFTCVNMSRHLNLDAQRSLRNATRKFERRFRGVEALASRQGVVWDDLDADSMDAMWQQVKNNESEV